MPDRRTSIAPSAAQTELARSLAELRASLDLPAGFPEAVDAEAREAAAAPPPPAADLTAVPFLTIDPPGSTDLDQALHLERAGDGYRVRYAIADVPAFVPPGGAIDAEARRRGQTLYAADGRIPLHPAAIGDDAASLLPGALRTAYVWDIVLAADGSERSSTVARARIRSRRQWDYAEAQEALDAGSAPEPLALLPEIGRARIEQERARGGASLNRPDEEIVFRDGAYAIERRAPLAAEDWNAQLSLLTGMAAARIMLDAKVGILRTMPAPSEEAVAAFRAQTVALGLPWPEGVDYGEYLRTLDHREPRAAAVLEAAAGLFRGAGYAVLDGEAPADPVQSAIAAPYAHTTAPLRRLVDRWALVICEALSAGRAVPAWARGSLAELPAVMGASSRLASKLDAESLARVEAALLASRIGAVFDGTVLGIRNGSMNVQLTEPAVTASVARPDGIRPGERVRLHLLGADIATGTVRFDVVG